MNKICKRCLNDKSIQLFGNDKRNKYGKQSRCYDCCNEVRRIKYLKNEKYREKQKTRQKKYKKYANNNAKKHIKKLSDLTLLWEVQQLQ